MKHRSKHTRILLTNREVEVIVGKIFNVGNLVITQIINKNPYKKWYKQNFKLIKDDNKRNKRSRTRMSEIFKKSKRIKK